MYKSNNCQKIGRVIRDRDGNPTEVTSTENDIVRGLFEVAGTFGLPFANQIFGILDSIFCGPKCRARRKAAASQIKGIGNVTNPTRFNPTTPKIF